MDGAAALAGGGVAEELGEPWDRLGGREIMQAVRVDERAGLIAGGDFDDACGAGDADALVAVGGGGFGAEVVDGDGGHAIATQLEEVGGLALAGGEHGGGARYAGGG